MSQSPVSMSKKRLRTMEQTDDDSDDQEILGESWARLERRLQNRKGQAPREAHASSSYSEDRNNRHDNSPLSQTTSSGVAHSSCGPKLFVWEASDTEDIGNTNRETADSDEDDDEEDEEDEEEEEMNPDVYSSYNDEDFEEESEMSESSGYQDHQIRILNEHYEIEDDSLDPESEDEDDDVEECLPDEYLKHDPTPDAPYPRPDWITVKELLGRKYGFASSHRRPRRTNMSWFERYANNSLWMIQRLQLEKKLRSHTSHVNCLDFNSDGRLICSGGDDLSVCIWDWQNKGSHLKARISTGHESNIFQSQFCQRDSSIITSGRDGQVRLLDIETNFSDLLMSSSGEIGKIAFVSPQTLVTCGTNACVNFIDLRTREAEKLFVVRSPRNNRSVPLHSVSSHPLDKHRIAVAGVYHQVFLYDLRRIPRDTYSTEHKPLSYLGYDKNLNHMITSTAFNSTGDKLLISYNDEDLYVVRTDTCELLHTYKGHRNKKTIKGCAWFGDNYVMSGSDDGHIYGWDLESEHIVCFLEADSGVVNCLSVHPGLPVLASSGMDTDVKIWEPVSSTWPQTLKGIKPQICKNTMRRKRANWRMSNMVQDLLDDETSENELNE